MQMVATLTVYDQSLVNTVLREAGPSLTQTVAEGHKALSLSQSL